MVGGAEDDKVEHAHGACAAGGEGEGGGEGRGCHRGHRGRRGGGQGGRGGCGRRQGDGQAAVQGPGDEFGLRVGEGGWSEVWERASKTPRWRAALCHYSRHTPPPGRGKGCAHAGVSPLPGVASAGASPPPQLPKPPSQTQTTSSPTQARTPPPRWPGWSAGTRQHSHGGCGGRRLLGWSLWRGGGGEGVRKARQFVFAIGRPRRARAVSCPRLLPPKPPVPVVGRLNCGPRSRWGGAAGASMKGQPPSPRTRDSRSRGASHRVSRRRPPQAPRHGGAGAHASRWREGRHVVVWSGGRGGRPGLFFSRRRARC